MKHKEPIQKGEHVTMVIDGEKIRISKIEAQYDFAFMYDKIANLFANKANEIIDNNREKSAYIISAIVFSCSFLEAALSEFFSITSHSKDSPLSDTEKKVFSVILSENLEPYGDKTTVTIFNMILRILGKNEIDTNSEPFRSTKAVFRLRNLLVHPFPDRVITFDENPSNQNPDQKIITELQKCMALSKNATFPKDILTYECAKWAITSCEKFFKEFTLKSGVNPGFILK